MIYYFKQHEVRKYLRRNRSTKKEVVSVSNVNNLSVEKHIELLNLNDENYGYIEYLGVVDNED